MNRPIARLVSFTSAAILAAAAGCASTGSAIEPPAPAPAATAATPLAAPASFHFKKQTKDGLTFRIEGMSASVQLNANGRSSRPGVRRDLSIRGYVSDPTGKRLFKISEVSLDEATDGRGQDLLAGADIQTQPSEAEDGWERVRQNRSPRSQMTLPFNVQINELEALPARLGHVRGHVDVDLVADMASVEIVPEASDKFIEAAPGFSYRVRDFDVEAERVRFVIEYRADQSAAAAPESPVFYGLDIRDRNGNPIYWNNPSHETAFGPKTTGIVTGEISLSRGAKPTFRLMVITRVQQVRFDFEIGGVALAEAARSD